MTRSTKILVFTLAALLLAGGVAAGVVAPSQARRGGPRNVPPVLESASAGSTTKTSTTDATVRVTAEPRPGHVTRTTGGVPQNKASSGSATDDSDARPVSLGDDIRHVTPASSSRWLTGYYWVHQQELMPLDEIDWSAMTHIAVARAVPHADGSLDLSFDADPATAPDFVKQLTAAARAHGVVPILMVGGAGAHDPFVAAARSAQDALVRNMVGAMHDLGFAGIDIDLEPIATNDQPAVSGLVSALRGAAPDAVLTLPAMWVTSSAPSFYGEIARQLDRINVMTYGMAGAWDGWQSWHSSALTGAGAQTPSSVASNVDSFLAAGVPASKLGVGVGFYGTCWNGVSAPGQDLNGATVVADDAGMTYSHIMSSYFQAGAYHYDEVAKAPYLSFSQPAGPEGCTYISYENADSISAKGAFARSHGLGGAIVWTINEGHVDGHDALLHVARTAFTA